MAGAAFPPRASCSECRARLSQLGGWRAERLTADQGPHSQQGAHFPLESGPAQSVAVEWRRAWGAAPRGELLCGHLQPGKWTLGHCCPHLCVCSHHQVSPSHFTESQAETIFPVTVAWGWSQVLSGLKAHVTATCPLPPNMTHVCP